MKQTDKTLLVLLQRGRASRAYTHSFLLALALGWLGAGASPVLAQDQTVPQALTIQTLEVTNLPSGPAASISFSIAGSKVFYFPVYAIWTVQYKDASGQFRPLFDAAGNHLLPASLTEAEICLTVRDYLKNGTLQQEIIQYLRNSPVVHDQSPSGLPVPAAIENPAPPIRLVLTRGLNSTTLGSGLLPTAQGSEFPKASVFLDSTALAALRAAPQPAARALRLSVDHTYRAQFISFDLTVNLNTTESSLAQMVGSLRPIPAGRPTYLLSSRLPTMLPGGGVDRDVQFISQVRSATQIQVLQRAGSQVSPTMIDRMLDTALNQANLAVQIATAERQRAIATVLLDDGLSITLPLGRLNEVAADIRTDSTHQWSDAFTSSATRSTVTLRPLSTISALVVTAAPQWISIGTGRAAIT